MDKHNTNAFNVEDLKEEHKIVYQLDDVTKETEAKASELFEQLNSIMENLMHFQTTIENLDYDKLTSMEIKAKLTVELKSVQDSQTMVGDSMCLMQYQDINRQKIERVINVIRSLSQYLNYLFEGKVSDSHRPGSATHIEGDESDSQLLSDEELENLLSAMNDDK